MAKKDLATTTVSLGIRICGVRVCRFLLCARAPPDIHTSSMCCVQICDIDTGAVLKEGKPWGKKIKDNEMLDRLKLFLSTSHMRPIPTVGASGLYICIALSHAGSL
jgi:hypothetical protein